MGLDYTVAPVRFPGPRDPDYFKINPLGAIPTLVDGEAKIFELVGIVDYLARRYGPTPLSPSPHDAAFPAYIQGLHFGEAGLSAPLTYLLRARFMAPPESKTNWSLDDIRHLFAQRQRLVTDQLARAPTWPASTFTAADISVGYALLMGRWIRADEAYDGAINAYLVRITARPAYERAFAR